jgi:hypothetical protein
MGYEDFGFPPCGQGAIAQADDRMLIRNISQHIKQAQIHLEAAAEILPLIKNPHLRADAEKLLDFVTEV